MTTTEARNELYANFLEARAEAEAVWSAFEYFDTLDDIIFYSDPNFDRLWSEYYEETKYWTNRLIEIEKKLKTLDEIESEYQTKLEKLMYDEI